MLRTEFVKRSGNLAFAFNSSNTFNSLTIIYKSCHAMDHCGSECKNSNLDALQHNPARAHSLKLPSNAMTLILS